MLALVALLCLLAGAMRPEEPWAHFLGGITDSMPLTIVVLVWESRRLKKGRPDADSRGFLSERWSPGILLLFGLSGLIGTHRTVGRDPIGLVGSITAVIVTVLVWAAIDPVGRDRQGSRSDATLSLIKGFRLQYGRKAEKASYEVRLVRQCGLQTPVHGTNERESVCLKGVADVTTSPQSVRVM